MSAYSKFSCCSPFSPLPIIAVIKLFKYFGMIVVKGHATRSSNWVGIITAEFRERFVGNLGDEHDVVLNK
jgi:hypothetical protein